MASKYYITYEGNNYCGELNAAGVPHGEGSIYYQGSRRQYRGTFANGEPNGYGVMEYEDGMTYAGGWKDGYYHGYGRLTYPDLSVREGYWKDGRFFGN